MTELEIRLQIQNLVVARDNLIKSINNGANKEAFQEAITNINYEIARLEQLLKEE